LQEDLQKIHNFTGGGNLSLRWWLFSDFPGIAWQNGGRIGQEGRRRFLEKFRLPLLNSGAIMY
jgi:hypothetical protein